MLLSITCWWRPLSIGILPVIPYMTCLPTSGVFAWSNYFTAVCFVWRHESIWLVFVSCIVQTEAQSNQDASVMSEIVARREKTWRTT
jgi:hypothetical protein